MDLNSGVCRVKHRPSSSKRQAFFQSPTEICVRSYYEYLKQWIAVWIWVSKSADSVYCATLMYQKKSYCHII